MYDLRAGCMLYLLDITSKFHTITMLVIVDVQTEFHVWYMGMLMICSVPNFIFFSLNGLLTITITLNAKENSCMAAILLSYIL
jgi:hypothetical protein